MSSLFESYDLAGQRLSNRIVMAPMTRARVKDTVPSADMAIYYAQRAGAGLIITESAQVSAQGRGYLYTPGIHTPAQIEGWKRVTDAVHLAGGAHCHSALACGAGLALILAGGEGAGRTCGGICRANVGTRL